MADQKLVRATIEAPHIGLLLLEVQRALIEGMSLVPSSPLLRNASRGDGHSVLVLPGLIAGDFSTRPMRNYLRRQGYRAHGWKLGPNLGLRADLPERLASRIDDLFRKSGRAISLVGWSLGGIYAREIAKRRPQQIRQVITLGSPFGDAGRATNLTPLFDLLSSANYSGRFASGKRGALVEQLRHPPDVPSTAIYSRSDGVAHWRACLEPETDHTDNIEVLGSHCGLIVNPLVLYAVADRLSQAESTWRPFARVGWRRHIYG